MSAPEKQHPDLREFIQDPDLPLDQARGLSGNDQETARRQRHLDQRLKAAMSEVHTRVDRHQPDGDTFMLRLQNSIEAMDHESEVASRKKDERDAAAYLGKIDWRRRVDWLRERFIFSENHGMRIAAAIGVLVIGLVPILVSQQSGSVETAMLEEDFKADHPQEVALADEAENSGHDGGAVPTSALEKTAGEEAGEPRLATAPGPVLTEGEIGTGDLPAIPKDLERSRKGTEPVLAARSPGVEAADDAALTVAAPDVDSTAFQIEILSARLKQAKTPEEKLVILRGLRTLYQKAGQKSKMTETNRQIEALK